jgi:Holliday junction resolvasome RuvABC endonuclease subunit
MNFRPTTYNRVLAIDPCSRGFGFAVLEGSDRLIDWGVKETRTDKNKAALKLIGHLIERYEPHTIVLENHAATGSRRSGRVKQLIEQISHAAFNRQIKIKTVSRLKVKEVFGACGARNKYDIAVAIANRFPELAPRLPRFRKPWMSEDYRMSIFDAVGLSLTFFTLHNKRRMSSSRLASIVCGSPD